MTYNSFLDSVHHASQDAERDFGIVSRYLMNGIRHLGADSVQETAKEVLNNPHPALVGFGLAGDELHFPPDLFTKTFDMLKHENIPSLFMLENGTVQKIYVMLLISYIQLV